jgi:hypothetical protein
VTVALLVLAGVLIGGVYSFGRQRLWVIAGVLFAAALLALAGAIAWSGR